MTKKNPAATATRRGTQRKQEAAQGNPRAYVMGHAVQYKENAIGSYIPRQGDRRGKKRNNSVAQMWVAWGGLGGGLEGLNFSPLLAGENEGARAK